MKLRTIVFLTLLLGRGGAAQDLPTPQWQPRFLGVDVATFTASSPRPLKAYAVRLNLRVPSLELVATPGNGDRPGETDSLKTTTFLEQYKLQAAINAAPFDIVHSREGQPQNVSGLLVARGEVVSPPAKLPAFVMTKERRARIATAPVALKNAWVGVGGFAVVLKGGQPTGSGDSKLHPRTAAGVSADGKTVYWLVIDGRQPGRSEGVTCRELAGWLKALGAADGLNLDGGGTSLLAVQGRDGKADTLNVPIHNSIPGWERVAGCHLGVRAAPLPE